MAALSCAGRCTLAASVAAQITFYNLNHQPIAVIEAKDNKQPVGHEMQQARNYAEVLDVTFAFSSNGDGILYHVKTGLGGKTETELPLDQFLPVSSSCGPGTASTWLSTIPPGKSSKHCSMKKEAAARRATIR